MTFDTGNIISLIALGVAVCGHLVAYLTTIADIKSRVTAIEVKTSVFWGIMEKRLADMLHAPDPEHWPTDYLLERFRVDPDHLNDAELDRLIDGVYRRYREATHDPALRLTAILFMAQLDARKAEREFKRQHPWVSAWWNSFRAACKSFFKS